MEQTPGIKQMHSKKEVLLLHMGYCEGRRFTGSQLPTVRVAALCPPSTQDRAATQGKLFPYRTTARKETVTKGHPIHVSCWS